MRFLSFIHDGKASFGAAAGEGIIDLGARHGNLADLRDALRQDRLQGLAGDAASLDPDYGITDIEFLPPVPNAEKIICIGVNYANRNAEYKDDSELPKYPSVFMRSRESLVGHRQPIMDPPESDQLDYEGEIVLVIGREGLFAPRQVQCHAG